MKKELETLQFPPFFLVKKRKSTTSSEHLEVHPLSNWDDFWAHKMDDFEYERKVGIIDSSSSLASIPSWSLRNFLLFIAFQFYTSSPFSSSTHSSIQVVCFRDIRYPFENEEVTTSSFASKIIDVQFPEGNLLLTIDRIVCKKYFGEGEWKKVSEPVGSADGSLMSIGWEKNVETGKYGPKYVNLSSTLDPRKLASSSVDLNIQLMQWRLLPQLNLQKLKETKVLLLGGGTLGCNVARNIIGWGIRHITIVDSGRVSFSNPVRQSLFEYSDCLHGGKFKAEAATEKLKAIFPDLHATPVILSIPMPGHPVPLQEQKNIEKDIQTISNLIMEHDVVYLLTDSRESRWLPTLLAKAHHKLAITVALGFDSFLVLRHGVSTSSHSHEFDLGCYFCNDVVAPMDVFSFI